MMLAERLTCRITLPCGGREWPLVFTHAVLLDIEAATGLDVLGGGVNIGQPTAEALHAILMAVLRAAGCEPTRAQLRSLLHLRRIAQVQWTLSEAWVAAMPDPEDETAGSDEDQSDPATKKKLTWLSAWAEADQDLGLTAEEWLSMTPRMVQALARHRLDRVRERELLQSMLIATVANFSMAPPKEPYQPKRFMLHPWPEEKEDAGDFGDQVVKSFAQFRKYGLAKGNIK